MTEGVREIRCPGPVRSVAEATELTGLPAERFVKTLLVVADGTPVLCLVGGARRLDTERVRRVLGAKKAKMASAADVQNHTGFAPGSVPPFGHASALRTLCDDAVPADGELCFGGGAPDTLLSLSRARLCELTRLEVTPITK